MTFNNRDKKQTFYKSRSWSVIRAEHLSRYPLCMMCEQMGLIVPAQIVDHCLSFDSGADELARDSNNLTSLCKSHHDSITARFDRSKVLEGLSIDEAKSIKYVALTHDDDGFPL